MKHAQKHTRPHMPSGAGAGRTSLRKKGMDNLASAEEKIKETARILFTKNGFDAVKTRDIAKESGINLALLNYYFRSKEKLFEIVMQENMQQFFMSIIQVINDEKTTIQQKIESLVNKYIDMLLQNPELPIFVIIQMRNNPSRLELQGKFRESFFIKQVQAAIKNKEIAPINPINIMMNMVGLTIFPFIGKPLLTIGHGITDEQFYQLMQERKTLIPKWMDSILKIDK